MLSPNHGCDSMSADKPLEYYGPPQWPPERFFYYEERLFKFLASCGQAPFIGPVKPVELTPIDLSTYGWPTEDEPQTGKPRPSQDE